MPALDWAQPWFAPWRDPGERLASRIAAGEAAHAALNAGGAPVRFTPQQSLPGGMAYEQFIFDTGQCPVRPGTHDFFNALVWMRFPRTKAVLNRLQAREITRSGIGGQRGRVRDAITILDENGALLQAPPPLWEALLERDWRRLFVELRPLWPQAQLVVFGHALLEKLAHPRKDLTAHVWCADMPAGAMEAMDAALAEALSAERLAAKPFTPLPVLGIPGWCEQNQNFSFYDDSFVFRPAGQKKPIKQARAAPAS
ncbi:membrane protein [Ramlibacter tataouinensis]|uniref:Membrane protein n=1 Tax=Ramlibacter tataouinensis TaxID=94132 RepID=A0A127JZZ3_9BURK|nr:DUF3025 domain-containing protein [Ramlibacter tataouinensis]AMO25530.1 membrane protein [Ramlibacter tataouinensis]